MKMICRFFGLVLLTIVAVPGGTQTLPPHDVRLSVPGPGSSVSLPLELASRLGLDTAQGLKLRLKFVGGGGVALQDLDSGNVDFSVLGLPAAMLAYQKNRQLAVLAAVENTSVWVLLARQGLQGRVKNVADLKGMTIGTHSSSLLAKTTGDVITRLVLSRHGVEQDHVRVTSAGQNWESQSAALLSKSVDAVMSDEPLASRLIEEKLAFPIFNSANAADTRSTPGLGFLRATLIGRRDKMDADSQTTTRLVKVIQTVLAKMHSSSAEQIADWMNLAEGKPRDTFIAIWKKYPNQYSFDAKFSNVQLRETELFVRESEPDNAAIQGLNLNDMVIDKWAGRKP